VKVGAAVAKTMRAAVGVGGGGDGGGEPQATSVVIMTSRPDVRARVSGLIRDVATLDTCRRDMVYVVAANATEGKQTGRRRATKVQVTNC
jgi:hypothetical protein